MSQTELAKRLNVPIQRVNQICRGRRAVTPDTALRLARVFGTTPEFWLNGQMIWDLWQALHAEGAEEIQKLQPVGSSDWHTEGLQLHSQSVERGVTGFLNCLFQDEHELTLERSVGSSCSLSQLLSDIVRHVLD
jgi:addiction module HigA family antidote